MAQQMSTYLTPRAFLIQYLDNSDDHGGYAKWIVEKESFTIDEVELVETWCKIRNYTRYRPAPTKYIVEFIRSILASTEVVKRNKDGVLECRLLTRSDQKRMSVNDLKASPLYQLIVKLLLERTRVDWLHITDPKELKFKILNIEKMGEVYSKVNGIKTGNGVYNIKLLLSSYCFTKIWVKIDKNEYQFSKEWLEKEYKRMEPEKDIDDMKRDFCESMALFPDQTLSCDHEHWLSFGQVEEQNLRF